MMETEEEEEVLLKTALKIEDTDDDFDLDIPPTTGNEYLRRVRQEAKECPDVVVANLDVTMFQNKQTVKVAQPDICHPAPRGLAPTLSWQKYQIDNFSSLRQKFIQHRANVIKGNIKPVKVPSVNQAEMWCRLCFGRLQVKKQHDVEPMVQNGDIEESKPTSTNFIDSTGSPPLVSIVASMAQPTVVKVLQYHVNWLEATGFTTHQGRWLYALMTALQKPLIPEACSLLRTLARLCAQIRATLTQDQINSNLLTELNLLICLVARYFDQVDLIEEGKT